MKCFFFHIRHLSLSKCLLWMRKSGPIVCLFFGQKFWRQCKRDSQNMRSYLFFLHAKILYDHFGQFLIVMHADPFKERKEDVYV